jgi:hypothetical protein
MPRQQKLDPERLKTLQQRLTKAQRALSKARSDAKDLARRDDARRKIIAGALALEHLGKNPASEFGKVLFGLLDEYARPDDRVLFEFLPVREAPKPDIIEATEAAE